ncbi:MAG: Fe-S cluster assembly protein SufD [Fimbriimonadaceae bacterium]|nr:Fe-S cluster assembly protein SufD [Fimbriimonadaceae bacterium]QYK55916.1 MAG: Fe-S cluster assembly protein SufD [Fimbriimonadaceae bacterium]
MTATLRYQASLADKVVPALPAGEPDWLAQLRRQALGAHREIGVPTPKHEEWKYTPLRLVAETNWRAGEPGPAVFDRPLPRYEEESLQVVLVNGRFDRNLSLSGAPKLPPGVVIQSLRDAIQERPDFVLPYLAQVKPETTSAVGRVIRPDVHPFAELNTAAFVDGLFISLSREATVDQLIEIVHVATGEGQAFFPRLLVVAETGSSARIVESYIAHGTERTLTLPVTEVVVREGANIEHVRVQDESVDSVHIASWQTAQSRDSSYHSYNVCFGGSIARVDQGIWLGGEGTTTRLDGVVCADGGQHIDNHTRLDHAFPNGNSFEVYKQVVDDEATVVFNGKIFVHQDAQKTDAKQTNQALLLSPRATIDSKPQLEIFADDVKCTHGATVGQLEDLPLFYMRSRGIPKAQAEAVLVYAFAAEVMELISMDSVRQALERRLYEKLGISD